MMASLHETLADRHEHAPSTLQGQETTPPGPLGVPEVLSIVGSFLTLGSLSVCLRVSRTWYDTFLSWLWCEVNLNSRFLKLPSVEAVRKHVALVRRLEIKRVRGNAFIHQLTYPKVSTLMISAHVHAAKDNELHEDLQLIDKFPRLQRLEYAGKMLNYPEIWFSQKKEIWSRLETLSLQEPWLFFSYAPALLPSNEVAIPDEIQDGTILGRNCNDKELECGRLHSVQT